jgi:hypothetical protein
LNQNWTCILFFGEVLLTERVDFVSADTFIEGFRDRQVQAGEQLGHSLFFPAEQHRHSLTAIMSHRHTTNWAYVADGDLAMFQEFRDVRQALI